MLENEIDRVGFYNHLGNCKSKREILNLIDDIDDDELREKIEDKYNQILQYNKKEDIRNIIKILEFTYLRIVNESKE